MSAQPPLQALIAQTERERDAALVHHQRAVAACRAAEDQAEQLLAYRRDYQAHWHTQFAREGKIELVHCYQGFMERLSSAIDSQTRSVKNAVLQVERAGIALRDRELRCASVQRLVERRVMDVKVDVERRAQRSSDEYAARAAWSRNAAVESVGAASSNPLA